MRKPSTLVLLVTAATFVAGGCSTSVHYDPPSPYTAIEARRGDSVLQIRYLSPEGLLYSESPWPTEPRSHAPDEDRPPSLFVLSPSATGREPPSGALSGRRLPLLGPQDYARIRDGLAASAIPADVETALVVSTHGHDVTLRHDAKAGYRSELGSPPVGTAVSDRISLDQYLARRPGTLDRLLREQGIESREVLFNTGDSGADALPFLYVDLDSSRAAFVRVQPLGIPPATASGTITPITQSVSHFVTSHTMGLVNRPITSVLRLIFAFTDAVRDTFDPVWTLALESADIRPIGDHPGMDLAAWEAEVDDLLGRTSSTGTISYLVDGDAFFPRLEDAVREADESILLRTYIFDNDDYALRFADLLRKRGDCGVEVRVLMDGLGTLAAGTQPPAGLPPNHESPASIHEYLAAGSQLEVRTALNPFFTGDHTKMIVIDEQVAFLGGMNIGREYRYEWHDLMAEIHGPVVAELADDFDRAWAGAGFLGDFQELLHHIGPKRTPGPPAGHPMRVLYTRPTVSEIRKVQLAAIDRARSYIYLQNAYFTDDTFLHELVRARRRGVDVRVIVPLQSDRGILARDNVLAANVMFRNGIRVYIYPGMSHIKAAVYDGWACLGSANVDQLSLRINREANIATSTPALVRPLLDDVFEADFQASPEMREEFPTYWHDLLWEMVGDYVF